MVKSDAPAKSLTRRRFLAAGAAAAVAPMFVPSRVLGQDAPSRQLTLAAIGVGARGEENIRSFLSRPDVRVVAACDCRKKRREMFAKMVNRKYDGEVCRPYADFREVLARGDIDGVVVSTPDHWHVPIAFHAARAKKDMYIEKPLGVAMAWAWKLREEVGKNKVVFQYGTQQRSDKQFRQAVNLVRNGHIGKIQRVEVWCPDMSNQLKSAKVKPYGATVAAEVPADLDYEMWIGPAPMKPYTVDRCTNFGAYHIYDYALGFLAGWGAHPLDIAQWGLDMDQSSPVKYQGTGQIPPQGSLWDSIESWDVQCEYANGIPMQFMSSRVARSVIEKMENRPWCDHGTTFFGADGWVSVDRVKCHLCVKGQPQDPFKIEFAPDAKLVTESSSQAGNFVECMKSRRPTINPLESAIRSDTISHLSDICIRTGRPVRWDPEKEKIVGDEEAAKMLDRPLRAPWTL